MKSIKVYKRAFRLWQQRPHEVAPMLDVCHVCSTCATEYTGNYCPRCGQSAKISRYSFKKAFLLFLDVWGLGNRGMFRTIRDLLMRPGYMIRDYLSGMQMAYFPPFKLFFLVSALSLVVSSGLNIKLKNNFDKKNNISIESNHKDNEETEGNTIVNLQEQATDNSPMTDTQEQTTDNSQMADEKEQTIRKINMGKKIGNFIDSHSTIISLILLVIMTGFLFPFFRKCPAIPDLRFSELVVAIIYMADMWSIVNIVIDFFCIDNTMLSFATLGLTVLPLKQLSGFNWKKTIAYSLIASMLMFITILILIITVAVLLGLLN